MKVTIYGIGGYDPSLPNNNIVEQYEVDEPEKTAEELARQSALDKLTALGLTAEEIQALIN